MQKSFNYKPESLDR